MDNKFSIIIPTMWRSDLIHEMLPIYDNSKFVGEIIIIDNDPTKTPPLSHYNKIKYYTKGENIFVNPAWNWGVLLASYKIILANDDILIENIDAILSATLNSPHDIIGVNIKDQDGITSINTIKRFPANSYGCFMYIKNYMVIPEQLKIWYGDKLLFQHNKLRGIYCGFGIEIQKSTTINSDVKLFRETIGKNDIAEYKKLFVY
jgi:hypothetical protein